MKLGSWSHFHQGRKSLGSSEVYTVKLNPDGSLACLKARFVTKGFSHVYGLEYVDTFFLVVKMKFVQILVSLAATYH